MAIDRENCYCSIGDALRSLWALNSDLNSLLSAEFVFPNGDTNLKISKCGCRVLVDQTGTSIVVCKTDCLTVSKVTYEFRIRSNSKGKAQRILDCMKDWCIPDFCTQSSDVSCATVLTFTEERTRTGDDYRMATIRYEFLVNESRCSG